MFKAILWDIDNTLLDFTLAEKNALIAGFNKFNLGVCTEEMCERYAAINALYWEKLEKGELSKEEILVGRFQTFLNEYRMNTDFASAFNDFFENELKNTVEPIENGIEIVRSLKGRYRQYAVTNGAYPIQTYKLKKSGLDQLFDGVFISDQVGYEKPRTSFFRYALKHIIPCEEKEILIVGDSLTSDMKGGSNIGIRCCWYNPKYAVNNTEIAIDYEIHKLNEIYHILGGNLNENYSQVLHQNRSHKATCRGDCRCCRR